MRFITTCVFFVGSVIYKIKYFIVEDKTRNIISALSGKYFIGKLFEA